MNFIELVGTDRHGVTRLKLFGIDGVPVQEEIRDGAVVLGQVVNESLELRVSQTVVAESVMTNKLG